MVDEVVVRRRWNGAIRPTLAVAGGITAGAIGVRHLLCCQWLVQRLKEYLLRSLHLDVSLSVVVILEILQNVGFGLIVDESGQHLDALGVRDLLSVAAEGDGAAIVVGQLDVLEVLIGNVLDVDPLHDEGPLPLSVLHPTPKVAVRVVIGYHLSHSAEAAASIDAEKEINRTSQRRIPCINVRRSDIALILHRGAFRLLYPPSTTRIVLTVDALRFVEGFVQFTISALRRTP